MTRTNATSMHRHPILRAAFAGALLLGAAGCAGPTDRTVLGGVSPTLSDDLDLYFVDYGDVERMAPQGTLFTQGLRQGYLDLGQSLPPIDVGDTTHFARKAVASAKGLNVQPDMPGFRRLSSEAGNDATIGRARMMAAFDADGRRAAPEAAATAQVSYDCWLERLATVDTAGQERCRRAFEEALAEVERALTGGVGNVYVVFFAWDEAVITPIGEEILDQVAEDFENGLASKIVVAGHTDRSGSEAYNEGLSERRARAVAAALEARGLGPDATDITWYGETQMRVITDDGVREAQNRRVEILFQ